jgi:hypothetical protein
MYTQLEEFAAVGDIRNIQQMWTQTIQLFENGDYDTEAMYKIYRAMSPKLTFQDIANVFSAVYADTYWNVTYMDASALAKSMVQALGVSRSQANTYALQAMRQWRGVLCRKNIQDTGIIPVGGSCTASLDIICNENTELMPQQLIENWNNEYWKQPVVGKNYIYARCQNMDFMGDLSKDVKVQMFYTTGGFNQPPSSWVQCYTAADDKEQGKVILIGSEMDSGDRGASEAFYFNPKSQDHVCIIASATTAYFTKNDPTKISSNWSSSRWITCNGAAAWHNVNPQMNLEETLKMYNQDGSDENFTITAQCKNVPKGSKIRLQSKDPRVQLDTGLIEITNPSQTIQKQFTLPGCYAGNLSIQLEDPNGNQLPDQSAVTLSMQWSLRPGHPDYMTAADSLGAVQAVNNRQDLQVGVGEYTIVGSQR